MHSKIMELIAMHMEKRSINIVTSKEETEEFKIFQLGIAVGTMKRNKVIVRTSHTTRYSNEIANVYCKKKKKKLDINLVELNPGER